MVYKSGKTRPSSLLPTQRPENQLDIYADNVVLWSFMLVETFAVCDVIPILYYLCTSGLLCILNLVTKRLEFHNLLVSTLNCICSITNQNVHTVVRDG